MKNTEAAMTPVPGQSRRFPTSAGIFLGLGLGGVRRHCAAPDPAVASHGNERRLSAGQPGKPQVQHLA